MSDTKLPKLTPDDLKFLLVIIFIVANTYLVMNGHQQLDKDILQVEAAAQQCQRVMTR